MFSDNLIRFRKMAGLSQLDLADAIGVSRQAVSKYETGVSEPDIQKLTEIASLLNVTMDQLLVTAESNKTVAKSAEYIGKIMISTSDQRRLASFHGFQSAYNISFSKEKRYSLVGEADGSKLFGDQLIVLGQYPTKDAVRREINAIQDAMDHGDPSYQLQFATIN